MRNVKMWPSRLRPIISSLILFGLGVTTCLMFVQMSQNGLDGPAVYTNSQEYQSPQALQQTQQETPCDTSINSNNNQNNGVNSINGGEIFNHIHPGGNNKRNAIFKENPITPSSSLPSSGNTNGGGGGQASKYRGAIQLKSSAIQSSEILIKKSDNFDENNGINSEYNNNNNNGPTVWVITPTFYRPEQKPEITRLAQALLPVRHFIHWILVEDISHGSNFSFKDLQQFMSSRFSQIEYTILKSVPPKSNTKIVGKPRGVGGRRAAIEWLRKQFENGKKSSANGVVYFADDDNTYDTDIFRQMQVGTPKVSMWPVGLVTDFGVSTPIIQNGKVVGFYDGWSGLRKFPVDMASFAINIQLFLDKPDANMPWVAGYEEDELLKSLGITIKDIKPLANNCTEILVWHTKAQRHPWPKRPKAMKPGLVTSTNLFQLLRSLPQKSLGGPGISNKADTGFSLLNMIFGGL